MKTIKTDGWEMRGLMIVIFWACIGIAILFQVGCTTNDDDDECTENHVLDEDGFCIPVPADCEDPRSVEATFPDACTGGLVSLDELWISYPGQSERTAIQWINGDPAGHYVIEGICIGVRGAYQIETNAENYVTRSGPVFFDEETPQFELEPIDGCDPIEQVDDDPIDPPLIVDPPPAPADIQSRAMGLCKLAMIDLSIDVDQCQVIFGLSTLLDQYFNCPGLIMSFDVTAIDALDACCFMFVDYIAQGFEPILQDVCPL